VIPAALAALRCPHCAAALHERDGTLGCAHGHRFDRARQGYVSLLQPGASVAGDSVAMVEARERVLAAGILQVVTDTLADVCRHAAADRAHGLAVDLGAGTGHHLAAVLEALPGWHGIAVDVSKPALRRAARAHPRLAAIAADAWRPLPLRDTSAAVVQAVFAPRDLAEVARILAPDGAFVLVTPAPEHLGELVGALDLVRVDPRKAERLERSAAGLLRRVDARAVRATVAVDAAQAEALVRMGPSAHHLGDDELRQRLPPSSQVTVAVDVATYRRA
jgi:23S rRNA (guanine745-N1)-methyltransferase